MQGAEDLVDLIMERKFHKEQKAHETFNNKVVKAIDQMLSDLSFRVEVDLDESDLSVLSSVTEELRDLGYKFCLIADRHLNGEIISNKLAISVEHLK